MDFLRQLFGYLRAHRRWWLAPIVLCIVVLGLLVAVSLASPLSPFIYPLF